MGDQISDVMLMSCLAPLWPFMVDHVFSRHIDYCLGNDLLDEAQSRALARLAVLDSADADTESRDYDRACIWGILCLVLLRQERWRELGECADSILRTEAAPTDTLNQARLWKAIACRKEGNEKDALQLCKQASACQTRSDDLPPEGFYEAQCAFHEAQTVPDYALVLKVRRKQLRQLRNRGMTTAELRCSIEILRALALQGSKRVRRDLDRTKVLAPSQASQTRLVRSDLRW